MLALLQSDAGTTYAWILFATTVVAFLISLVLVLSRHTHGHFTMDHAESGAHKFHVDPTPRVGGIGIYLALVLAWALLSPSDVQRLLGMILLAGIPALLFGLVEDMTKRVGVLPRLLATMVSGLVACLLSGVALSRLDVPLLDWALTWWPLAVVFTAFAVGGVANAVNIIDGFHGLASGTVVLALVTLSVLAFRAGDAPLALVCLLVAAAMVGFWLINYPWGKLFLGDGGAYFAGFALAWLAVLLPMRNASVSPWASLLVCAYPFIEVVYSIVRRRLQRLSPGDADRHHLHSLLASAFIHRRFPHWSHGWQNAAVAPVVWCFVAGPALLALVFHDDTEVLAVGMLAAVAAYHHVYQRLARRGESLATLSQAPNGALPVPVPLDPP
ncbi:glycosyltransferase [Hydrogenophaga sp.]|uniref:MraY family glycosyltransferase n=1 Tax=Hydrogenophaga sp. TaxID=1904254 RepID=UPI002724A906|nr:glycosyltransferase [Hydrogenophaga sp.]MDO9604894.1 glycosyltransferase [Hydrogenophaga sp.]